MYIHSVGQPSLPASFRTFSSSQTGTWSLLNTDSPFPVLLAPAPAMLFCLHRSDSSGTSYKWSHTVFVLLCLAYFIEQNVLWVHPCWGMW